MEEEDGGAEAEPEGEAETEETKAEGMPDEGTGVWGGVLRCQSSTCLLAHVPVTSGWAGDAEVHFLVGDHQSGAFHG